MSYSYPYPRPAVTATVMLVYDGGDEIEFLLGKRSDDADAYPGALCLPGGFLDAKTDSFAGETVKQAAVREVLEETGLKIKESGLNLFSEYSNPTIDPRCHVVNLCFLYFVDADQYKSVKAGDDLAELSWHPIEDYEEFKYGFNHKEIIKDGLEYLDMLNLA